MTNNITVDGVTIRRINGEFQLHLPDGMNGSMLQDWRERNANDIREAKLKLVKQEKNG